MGYYDNPVSTPGEYGFEFVGVVEKSGYSYEFDLLAVLKNDEGYYLTTDSGCSCPTPWESHTVDDLTGPLTAEQAREEATSLWELSQQYDEDEFVELLASII